MINNFYHIFIDLDFLGKDASPRGLLVKEIENYSYTLQPYERFCSFASRKLSVPYIKKEFLWYLKGDKQDTSITEHASMWKNLINQDGSINSNYGQYVFADNQFDQVVDTLIKDKDSRRAVIMLLNKNHLFSDTKDVPCTYSMSFRIRENCLNMSVRMRSQDAILGMGNDAPAFSFIHEMIYCVLKETYPELKLGQYHHTADSFHIYERHFQMLKDILDNDIFDQMTSCPKISGKAEVDFLRKLDFSSIPENFLFVKWLTM